MCLRGHYLLFAVLVLLMFSSWVPASGLKDDETVILFTTTARHDPVAKQWVIPLHGWIFELENHSLWRKATIKSLGKLLGLDDDRDLANNELFRQRAQLFLVDNERNKRLKIKLADHVVEMPKSKSNGHFDTTTQLPENQMQDSSASRWLTTALEMPQNDSRQFSGRIQLLQQQGISVISDVDDTIKISNVLDKKELMRNTFLREMQPVPDIAKAYQKWYDAGASFHYISASPWQLYPVLNDFLQQHSLPPGSFNMKLFRVKDKSFNNLFVSPIEYKLPLISELMLQFPQRQFLLVGDSGEKDPEVYIQVLRRFPSQVKHIFIRDITKETAESERYRNLFNKNEQEKLTIFTNASDLLNYSL